MYDDAPFLALCLSSALAAATCFAALAWAAVQDGRDELAARLDRRA